MHSTDKKQHYSWKALLLSEFWGLERLRYFALAALSLSRQEPLSTFSIVLGGNLNVTARKPGCIHHLTLFLLGWLVTEFPVCRKVPCFGKNALFQVDWNFTCHS